MVYHKRLLFLMTIDSLIVLSSVFVSNFLLVPLSKPTLAVAVSSIVLLLCHHFFANRYKLYKRAWEYASVGELVAIWKGVTYSVAITLLVQLIAFQDINLRTLSITWMMHILLIGGIRFSWRMIRDMYINRADRSGGIESPADKKRTLIIGAGSAGVMVARQLKMTREAELYPVAFIDDDVKKHRLVTIGLPVLGGRDQIEKAVIEHNISNIVIAMPSLSKKELQSIVAECKRTQAKTQIIPRLEDLMLGKVSVNDFRDVQVEDLLGRESVQLDTRAIADYITGHTILVTGAGGSIGSEICRQITEFNPAKVVLLGHGENSIYSIEMELKSNNPNGIEYITEIADIQDRGKMFSIMRTHSPKAVFHAAAHKHVPLMERNPEEAIKNNILGTKNAAEASSAAGVDTFVMISTDKAVNPTSVMGATKRCAEMIIQDLDRRSRTRFVAVRFGNVLGSRGSVIPLFKEQIRKGGPLTVTHPDMVRYFMTIPEASRLVLQAGSLAKGGEIFVLDMGEPVKIVDLAKNLIRLSGFMEDEIGIQFTGMRPGEKMYEELLNENEVHEKQVYPKVYVGKSINYDMNDVHHLIKHYEALDSVALRNELLMLANHQKAQQQIPVLA
ncbi:polysaccharide biosynthesis protein [Paenibacillus xerothermodurans]|uniref:Polysaccharide biosynthesis protein n=1 Tax=Paenibacillus xerothermodurans TaxID=1977292 RepID=A0A2W1N787_PAEXE|nr:nucleoside-diphosphate sugar epimerase/dehydratase [Paenibacillus xerothermodurans]PZE20479.1 polysaccharide biosynthesis protein [Paenibacillus xerothermodurans]